MHIVITGGAGFLGARLARTLLANRNMSLRGAPAQAIQSITLVDRVGAPADLAADVRIKSLVGDLNHILDKKQALAQAIWARAALIGVAKTLH